MKIKTNLLIILLLCLVSNLKAQIPDLDLTLNYFNNYEIFYITDFDFDNAANNPDLFSYTLSYNPLSDNATIEITIEFEMIAIVPSLFDGTKQIFYVLTQFFEIKKGSITLTSRDIDMNMQSINYDDGTAVPGLRIDDSIFMDPDEFASMQQIVMASGRLPGGNYIFYLKITDKDGNIESIIQGIEVSNPTTLDLVSPGGALEDGLQIYTTFPVFLWESPESMWNDDNCPECGNYIRVAEYNSTIHSSVEDALSDDASLPYPDDGEYYKLPIVPVGMQLYTAENSFQYPLTGAKPLDWGKTYVWQTKKIYPTTSGAETVEGDIFAFTIPSRGGEETEGTTGGTEGANQYLQLLEQILGSDTYNQLFTGQLNGYLPTGVVILNGTQQLTLDQLSVLIGQFLAGEFTIQTITIE